MTRPGKRSISHSALVAMMLCGSVTAWNSSAHSGLGENDEPEKQTAPLKRSNATAAQTVEALPLVIPAPRKPKVAAGRGTTPVFALDQNGERITLPPAPSKRRKSRRGAVELGASKEIDAEITWIVVTSVVDHSVFAQNRPPDGSDYRLILPERLYRRVELERAERLRDKSWTEWRAVDRKPTMRVLNNLPEVDRELVPNELSIPALVDPLPYLKIGAWEGVDDHRIMPELNAIDAKKPQVAQGVLPDGRDKAAVSNAPSPSVLMLRQLDLGVERGRTYRYRARIVIIRRSPLEEVAGPWSEPTEPVAAP